MAEQKPLAETEGAEDAAPASESEVASEQLDGKPVRRATLIVAFICVVLFALYVLTDRHTPYTDSARVNGFVVPIVAEVSGYLVKVQADPNEAVAPGTVLARIDPSRYQLAVEQAAAALELAGQEVGAGTASVETAQAQLVAARANLDNTRVQAGRILAVEEKGVVTRAQADEARARVAQAEADLASAEAELERAKEQLGSQGQDNPRIRRALADLQEAQLDLARTELQAPSVGGVTNLQVDVGSYVKSGQPIMTFVSGNDVWIEADMRENSLGNIKPGDRAEILLDVAPGRLFEGVVDSIGPGVEIKSAGAPGDLPTPSAPKTWLRDAQRFPVIIRFVDQEAAGLRRVGGQADVVVYTGSNPLTNALGWVVIRLASILSYVY